MPTKKSGARKKREQQAERQKAIRSQPCRVDLAQHPVNLEFECDQCGKRQRNRAACYFCSAVNRVPRCADCGKIKCHGPSAVGECLVKHAGASASGLKMVGCICDHCEAFVCHSRRCVSEHACRCPLEEARCVECERAPQQVGGRWFRCATCDATLCEDDQMEHQASCQTLDAESFHCVSCSRFGRWACLRCKVAYCDEHVKSAVGAARAASTGVWPCKKCGYEVKETKDLPMSTRNYDYGRH